MKLEVEPFQDYLRVVQLEDAEELDIPIEEEIEFDYGPKT